MSNRFALADVRATYPARGAWWTVVLVDPVAARLVLPIANRTSLTPNQLTAAAAVLGAGAAAAFLDGSRTGLIAGAVLFHVSFVVDSMDGKLARLKGTSTIFGGWLDYILDRLRVATCTVALMSGQYLRTDRVIYLYLAMLVLFGEFFRQLHAASAKNAFHSAMRSADARHDDSDDTPAIGLGRLGIFGRSRAWLLRHRIRPHLWSGIEFEMFVFIVGPLAGAIIEVTIASLALLFLFELAFGYRVWQVTRAADHQTASSPALAGHPT